MVVGEEEEGPADSGLSTEIASGFEELRDSEGLGSEKDNVILT